MLTGATQRPSLWPCLVRLFVLHQADKRPTYGGRLKKQLSLLGYHISPGSLYPLLHQLEQTGLVRSWVKIYKGRARRLYELTAAGRSELQRLQAELAAAAAELLPPPQPSLTGKNAQEDSADSPGPA